MQFAVGRETHWLEKNPLKALLVRWTGRPYVLHSLVAMHLQDILRRLPTPPTSILDAGCGLGLYTFLLARMFPAASILGVDIAEDQIESAREIARREDLIGARFEKMDFTRMGNEEEFDMVICMSALHYFGDKDAMILRKFARALRPGGHVLLLAPAARADQIRFFRRDTASSADEETTMYGRTVDEKTFREKYRRADLETLVRDAGLTLAELRSVRGPVGALAVELDLACARALPARFALNPLLRLLAAADFHLRPQRGNNFLVLAGKEAAA